MVKLGLIGCGRITRLVHLNALARLRHARVVAVAEADPERLAEAAARVPLAARYGDYRDLLADGDVDAVVITLPPALHAEATIAAFEAGRHVYVEKPLAISREEGRAMLRARAASGRIGMVGFNYRFHPLYRRLREQVAAGRVGHISGVRTIFAAAARALPDWKTSRSTGGGALLDLASHHIDLIRFVFGQEIREVSAAVSSVRADQDTAALQMRLADGTGIQTFVSMAGAEDDRIEVLGDAGKLTADRYRERDLVFTPPARRLAPAQRLVDGVRAAGASPVGVLGVLLPPRDPSHQNALQAFVDAVSSGAPSPLPFGEGLRSLAVVLAAERSAARGRSVQVAVRKRTTPAAVPGDGPAMSVVVVATDGFASVRRTVRHLRDQTVRGQLELVLVGTSAEALSAHEPDELAGFHGVQKIAIGPIANIDKACAPGVRQARAPVVALVEDHAYPEPDWAEMLIEAHRGPWTAVGSLMLNANPGSALSWTNLFMGYGWWTEPLQSGETRLVPMHNLSIKRAALKGFEDRLEDFLGRDGRLLQALLDRGHRFFVETRARIHHANPSLLGSTVRLRFNAGRLNGATMAERGGWSRARRLIYAAGSPLIPLVRTRHLRGRVGRSGLGVKAYSALALGLALDGAGYFLGFTFGAGRTSRTLADFEFDRLRHVSAADRELLRQ
jgi:predicted dehydrogenase